MIVLPAGVKVHLALGHTEKGLDGLAALIQEHLKKDPFICGGADYVAAMNWSGMGHAEYAAALGLLPHALRIWRDRLEQSANEMDLRSLLIRVPGLN